MRCASRIAAFTIALLSVSLGGCFMSREPQLTAKDADYPFKKITLDLGDGRKPLTIVRKGDRYEFDDPDPKAPEEFFLFKKLADDVYLSQESFVTTSGLTVNIYAILRPREKEITTLYCGNYSAETLGAHGITVIKDDLVGDLINGEVCDLTRLDQLVALSKEKPDGARKQRTVKIVSVEK
jgi:hypothetical protein